MADPLELSYVWQPPVLFTSVGALVCLGAVVHARPYGWGPVIAILVALWLVVLGFIWVRTRAYLRVEGPRLTVRRFRRMHTIEAAQLVRVRQFLTGPGPCYRLVVRQPDGGQHSYVAPAALLKTGHSTLFGWILAHAPQAELDRGSTRTLDQLRVRGLVG